MLLLLERKSYHFRIQSVVMTNHTLGNFGTVDLEAAEPAELEQPFEPTENYLSMLINFIYGSFRS